MKIIVTDRTHSGVMTLLGCLREDAHVLIRSDSLEPGTGASAWILAEDGPGDGIVARVSELRARHPRMAIVIVGHDLPEAVLTAAYDAGLDVDVPLPASGEHLRSRLRAVERRLRSGSDALTRFVLADAWRHAPGKIATAASTFLTCPVSVADLSTATAPSVIGTQILLSSAVHQVEVRASIGADLASARQLATQLFGFDEDELTRDMLAELANIFMGVIKTAYALEDLAVTGGLPMAISPELVLRPPVTYQHQESFTLAADSAHLVVHIGMRSKANVRVAAEELKEGMVLASDLHNARGLPVYMAGTRLSMMMIEKIVALPVSAEVEVMAA